MKRRLNGEGREGRGRGRKRSTETGLPCYWNPVSGHFSTAQLSANTNQFLVAGHDLRHGGRTKAITGIGEGEKENMGSTTGGGIGNRCMRKWGTFEGAKRNRRGKDEEQARARRGTVEGRTPLAFYTARGGVGRVFGNEN